jgi:simple sugar transport system ATP-binding protein
MEAITKSFPGVLANDRVSFEVREAEIHALLGENGAGKTTLMRILYGMSRPDAGTITWRGEPVEIGSSRTAIELGIGMVHQDLQLIPEFSVVENVALGLRTASSPFLDLKSVARHLEEVSKQFGLPVEPWVRVNDLSNSEQQRLEIVRTLYRGADLLVMDEPTSILAPDERESLFSVLAGLRAEGRAVVFISHKIGEVLQLCDRVTVLRRGRVVTTVNTQDTSREELATLMVGRPVVLDVQRRPKQPGADVIRVEAASVDTDDHRHVIRDISLTVREGEILALTGVAGSGQHSLIQALFGLRRLTSGRILVLGRDISQCTPRDLVQLNVGRVPPDRETMGLVPALTVRENLALDTYFQPPHSRNGILREAASSDLAVRLKADYDIRTPTVDTPVANLSGGNRQKVVLAREMHRDPPALIAVDPTRGLDVGAAESVCRQILAARDRGAAVLLISTDLEEVLCVSDRIAVISNGEIMGEVPAEAADRTQLGLMMSGTRTNNPSGTRSPKA